jgi:hypothetical protein
VSQLESKVFEVIGILLGLFFIGFPLWVLMLSNIAIIGILKGKGGFHDDESKPRSGFGRN